MIPEIGSDVILSVECMDSPGGETFIVQVAANIDGVNVFDADTPRDTWELEEIPYTAVICSLPFIQKILDEMPEGTYWNDYAVLTPLSSPYEYRIASAHVYIAGEEAYYGCYEVVLEKGFDYSITDLAISSLYSEMADRVGKIEAAENAGLIPFTYLSYCAQNYAYVQTYTQSLILIVFSGICIAIITIFIISSAVRLETQREKRRYGILQAIGMSRRQRNLRLAGTALIRAVIAVVAGWGVYMLSLIYTNREAIGEGQSALTVISDYMTNIAKYYMSPAAMGIMTAILFAVVFGVCYISKLGLNRFSLMELLREER